MTTDQAAAGATTNNVTTLRTAYAAFAAGDLPVVLALLHPDVEWIETAGGPFAGTYRGLDAVTEGIFARMGREWSEFRVEPEEFVASGETVAVVGTFGGTYRATGKSSTARFVHVYWFRDGRVARFEGVADSATINTALS